MAGGDRHRAAALGTRLGETLGITWACVDRTRA